MSTSSFPFGSWPNEPSRRRACINTHIRIEDEALAEEVKGFESNTQTLKFSPIKERSLITKEDGRKAAEMRYALRAAEAIRLMLEAQEKEKEQEAT